MAGVEVIRFVEIVHWCARFIFSGGDNYLSLSLEIYSASLHYSALFCQRSRVLSYTPVKLITWL